VENELVFFKKRFPHHFVFILNLSSGSANKVMSFPVSVKGFAVGLGF